jgi:ribonucleoside-triphosphate reductase
LIEAGALTHLAGEGNRLNPPAVFTGLQLTQNDQIAFSPEFTTCNLCHRTSRGLRQSCAFCGSEDVDGITRITGYFTKVSSWNKGKLQSFESIQESSVSVECQMSKVDKV